MSSFYKVFKKLVSCSKVKRCELPEVVFPIVEDYEFKVLPLEKVPESALITGATDSRIKVVLNGKSI